MTWQKLAQGIVIASLILVFSEAVLSCDFSETVWAAGVRMILAYHLTAVGLGVGVLILFLLRRFKGIVILLFTVAALALSPGWSPNKNAVLNPSCEPIGALGVKIILGVVALCFLAQLIFWIFERRRSI